MSIDDHSRRGFLIGAGLVAGSFVGDAVLPATAEAQARAGGSSPAAASKGARFRAAIATGKPMMLPVVESLMLARLCELEGFSGGFMGGSGMAARNALPNRPAAIGRPRAARSTTRRSGGSPATSRRS